MIFRLQVIHIFIAIFSFCLFLISLSAQILGNMEPCQLCLISRYLFLLIAIFAFFSVYYKYSKFILVFLISILFLFSLYHLGVENHWWNGPQSCISELPSLSNIDTLMETDKVFCDRVNWTIFGISSTFWSFLAASFLTWLISISYVLNYYLKKFDD